MKTKLLLFLLSLWGANAFAQYTNIPDTKFEATLISLGIDDVADGKVLTSKVNTLTELSISSSSITDLTGIQDFVALSILSCGNNRITSLDLSKNTALTSLNCYGNQLTSLNLSANFSLKYLYCYSNKITSLDVSKNIALTSLNCRGNAIKSLDLSKNAALTSLDCAGNLLTYLNIKNSKNTSLSKYSLYLGGNVALSCITVDDAAFSNQNWSTNKDFTAIYSSYDCSSITQIPDTKFEEKLIALGIDTDGKNGLVLNSSITSLTTLNVSNSSITDLEGLEGFIALKTLNCSNNLLSGIDISKNPALTSLDCSGNTTLTCIQVADINVAKTNITTTQDAKDKFNLDCRPYTLIPDSRFEAKLISLGYDTAVDGKVETKKINRIKSLNISNASITDLTGIQDFIALTYLDCGYNQLTNLDVSKNTALSTLICRSNKLTSIDISKNIALTSLSLTNNQLTGLNTANNTALNSISCDSNKITSLDFSKNTALTSIYCYNNQLTSLNIKNGKNKQTGTMNFYDNPLLTCVIVDDVEYAKDKWGTQANTPKKTFSPFECSSVTPIPDAKFEDKLIALGIDTDGKNGVVFNSSITALTTLDVSNSSITDLSGLEGFTALKTLNCSNNSLDRINISKNTALTTLNCSNNASLKCIQVNNIDVAKTNITTSQEAKDKFSLDCNSYTLIPDANFEKTLISMGYDTVADGKVLTKNIETIKSLELPWYNSIKDITGIQDFTSLTSLNIYSVAISTLDVSKNINLTTLDCSSIGLTSLDLSKNTKLTNLNCNSNKLTTLDLSNNTALETVNCTFNQLTNLNVNKNTALKNLYCNSNLLTAIDVSNNLALKTLGCDTNKITSIDISKNKNLNTLTCNGNRLSYLNLKNQNNNFNYLNCTGNLDLNCITVNDVTTANSKWTNSKDSHAYFTDQDCTTITVIPDAFFEDKLIALNIDKDGKNGYVLNSSIQTITSLDLSNSSITNLSGLEGFKALTTLNCSKNSLKNLDLTKNTVIKTLNCSNNAALTCIQVSDVNKATKNWTVTKDATAGFSLDCRIYTLIPDINFEAKLISLGYDTVADGKVETAKIDNITLINLNNASITDLKGIEDFKALTVLNCQNNNLSSLDISKNTSLKELDCSGNDLTNLDISKNAALLKLNCSWNNLVSLNLKNGKNTFFTDLSLSVNSNLNCITVDDIAYANANWSSKKNSTAIFTTYDCTAFTIISDSNFENKLIALGIDTDGKNGFVANSSIEKITQLDLSNSSIANLKGIEGFKALTQLNCSNNALILLDLNQNTSLTKIECQSNQITDLDIDKCISLTHLNAASNKLKNNFDSYYLKALTWLSVSNNEMTSLNLYQNSELETLLCNNNKLTSLSTWQLDKLKEINCSNNQITYLDNSNLVNLISLNVSGNKIGNIDFSNNTALTSLDISGNNFAQLLLLKNKALSKLNCSNNKIKELNLSQNKSLTDINCSGNQLTVLNLKNGNNTKFNITTFDLKNNPDLSCIKVDNRSYADTNWSDKKDASASFLTTCGLNIPANNFTVETRSESCANEKNGEINIYANEYYPYTASINGKSTAFVDNSLNITNLAPGNYTVLITIPDEDFEQKYTFTIEKATKVSGKSSISSKKVDVEIQEGTAPYTIFVDGVEQFETSENNFSVSAKEGLLEIKTAKACEGIYTKDIADLDVIVSAFPNPTTGNFNINIPGKKEEVFIEISSLDGRIISNKKHILENGTAKLTLDNEAKGVYLAKIYLDTIKTVKIIKN
ncbi:leucine-rich repeat domain-containing protein [Flavobacterium ajazii]|uniref:leucine-rich repeat domain-containing protein n=1 Tax=Flavobacterium ajazii TaxID=2692318 RepID=UPI0013D4285A|nr:leucine-rich repeat domain-containing protein [Flavobacterium ajazii]